MSDHIPAAMVTGASRGLGRGVARSLAAAGWSVAINYARNEPAARETVRVCQEAAADPAQRFVPVRGDIASREDRRILVEAAFGGLGRLDALVNNAGIAPRVRADITEATEESFEEVLRTNLQGPYFLTQAVVRRWLAESQAGRSPAGRKIVFVTSVSADTASTNRGDYCISKAGLSMARQLWAARLADLGILVYEVRPGIMATDMTAAVKEKYDSLIAGGLVPQRRWGTAEDVGRAVAALLQGVLPFSTGTVIEVDGGFHLKQL